VDLTLTKPHAPDLDFEGFFSHEYPRLVRALFLLCGDRAEAEDLAQEALARTYERWDRVKAMESATGYVYRIALNLHRRHLRRAKVLSSKLRPSDAEGNAVAEAEMRTDIVRTLLALPRDLRAALILHEWMGLTSDEAGKIMGIKPGSARARLHRARAAFRERLGDDHD
jgi:RNA polymerase sigma factor (sigma-70 family)